ncbi:two-component system sensor histidine kinase TctE [Sphaerotilus hippei]|uniref:histidine kinase n=1 Tax=Sphaerotilus hippei TaxID=744406 RepID=A0A318H1K1_9BURK|nr:sensor histidine kinase [Sphaerotilus hippei]PXW96908.1 two-component system sensor histidine kinase TctE [Sphaerotilus hippei]
MARLRPRAPGAATAAAGDGRRKEQRSLFGEILDWMLAPLLLLWPMSLALTWLAAQGIANKPYDRALVETVRSLSQRIEAPDDGVRFDLPRETARLLRSDEVDTVFYQVIGPAGEFLSGDRDLPSPPDADTATAGEVRMRDEELHGDGLRIAYLWVQLPGIERLALVQVGETLTKRSRLATEIIKGVILPQFVILPVAVLLVWLALARGLAPLGALQQRIHERPPDDLSPLDVRDVPEEVSPLVEAINDLLERQEVSLRTQKRFLADAAHQLKTPLAGMRMQAELALREIDAGHDDAQALKATLGHMAHASQQAAHTVNQLLSMARAEAKTGVPLQDRVDLLVLVTDVVRDAVPRALDLGIDLGFEGPEAPRDVARCQVLGHAVLLRELLVNLVDNALHYTPTGGVVTVRVQPQAEDGKVALQVEDSGPGIPPAERELVFQPFYRALGTTVDGSGLGLAIVAEVAALHGSVVELDDAREAAPGTAPGARFTLRLSSLPVDEPPEGGEAQPLLLTQASVAGGVPQLS